MPAASIQQIDATRPGGRRPLSRKEVSSRRRCPRSAAHDVNPTMMVELGNVVVQVDRSGRIAGSAALFAVCISLFCLCSLPWPGWRAGFMVEVLKVVDPPPHEPSFLPVFFSCGCLVAKLSTGTQAGWPFKS